MTCTGMRWRGVTGMALGIAAMSDASRSARNCWLVGFNLTDTHVKKIRNESQNMHHKCRRDVLRTSGMGSVSQVTEALLLLHRNGRPW